MTIREPISWNRPFNIPVRQGGLGQALTRMNKNELQAELEKLVWF